MYALPLMTLINVAGAKLQDGLTKYRALARDDILLIKKERMNVLALF